MNIGYMYSLIAVIVLFLLAASCGNSEGDRGSSPVYHPVDKSQNKYNDGQIRYDNSEKYLAPRKFDTDKRQQKQNDDRYEGIHVTNNHYTVTSLGGFMTPCCYKTDMSFEACLHIIII